MRKKILVLTAYPPNDMTAGQSYTKTLISRLSQRYDINVLYFPYRGHKADLPHVVESSQLDCSSIKNMLKLFWLFPLFSKRYEKKIARYIEKQSSGCDVVYFDFSQVLIYAKYISHPCKIGMVHDVISQKYGRKCKLLGLWAWITEKKMVNNLDSLFCFSNKDSLILQREYGVNARVVNFYIKQYKDLDVVIKNHEDVFCFYGAWGRKENLSGLLWFIKKVYPLINKKYKYLVIGGNLDSRILKGFPDFSYMGFVDNPISILKSSQGLIAPLWQGAGVKVKVIDALSAGIPVVGTEIAFEGIIDDEINNTNIRICLSARDFSTTLNEWRTVTMEEKENAREAFRLTYDMNHFDQVIHEFMNNC